MYLYKVSQIILHVIDVTQFWKENIKENKHKELNKFIKLAKDNDYIFLHELKDDKIMCSLEINIIKTELKENEVEKTKQSDTTLNDIKLLLINIVNRLEIIEKRLDNLTLEFNEFRSTMLSLPTIARELKLIEKHNKNFFYY